MARSTMVCVKVMVVCFKGIKDFGKMVMLLKATRPMPMRSVFSVVSSNIILKPMGIVVNEFARHSRQNHRSCITTLRGTEGK